MLFDGSVKHMILLKLTSLQSSQHEVFRFRFPNDVIDAQEIAFFRSSVNCVPWGCSAKSVRDARLIRSQWIDNLLQIIHYLVENVSKRMGGETRHQSDRETGSFVL